MVGRNAVIIISDSPSPPQISPESLPEEPEFSDAELVSLAQPSSDQPSPMSPVLRSDAALSGSQNEALSRCEQAVLSCFPDICREYLKTEAAKHGWDSQRVISHILDEQEKGRPTPKQPNPLKRKRPEKDEEGVDEARKRFERADPRLARKGREYVRLHTKAAHRLLKASFPQRYAEDIERLLKENDYQLYPTYLALDKDSWSPDAEPIRVKKGGSRREQPETSLRNSGIEAEMDALAAFDAARAVCEANAQARAEEKRKSDEEEENEKRARAEGTMGECGCCFDEKPLNRMVHCDGESAMHWFCVACARQMAEHTVGLSKYQLSCMSMDGCDASFSRDQRRLFLDDKLTTALELIEQEAVLRLAGIENLETCPFCPYAAEYPPVEENKEFRCENSECALVSCRLCRQETHIPKTCSEAVRERGHSARRAIEEAMSAALIRKCNKCGTPFIKENGCNKMTCTAPGCRNVQCYVCHKSCDYSHFDDSSRGGKKGNCPLFDSVEQRHENEVKAAEEEARKRVAEENPDVDGEALTIDFSDKVKQDDERRKAANPGPYRVPAPAVPMVHPGALLNPPAEWFGPLAPGAWLEPPPLPGFAPFGNQAGAAPVAQPVQPAQPAQQAQPAPAAPPAQERRIQQAPAVQQGPLNAAYAQLFDLGVPPIPWVPYHVGVNPADRPNPPHPAVPVATPAQPMDPAPPANGGRDADLAGNDRMAILARASQAAAQHVRDAHAAHIRANRMAAEQVRNAGAAHARAANEARRYMDVARDNIGFAHYRVNQWAMMAGRGGEVANNNGQGRVGQQQQQPGGGQGNNRNPQQQQQGAAAPNRNANPGLGAVQPALAAAPVRPGYEPMVQPRRYQAGAWRRLQRGDGEN